MNTAWAVVGNLQVGGRRQAGHGCARSGLLLGVHAAEPPIASIRCKSLQVGHLRAKLGIVALDRPTDLSFLMLIGEVAIGRLTDTKSLVSVNWPTSRRVSVNLDRVLKWPDSHTKHRLRGLTSAGSVYRRLTEGVVEVKGQRISERREHPV
jgi:hypothetical protein